MKKKLLLIFLTAFFFRVIFAFSIWHPDVNNHIDWGIRFFEYGPSRFYKENAWSYTWPNQPPGTIYIFAGIRKLYEIVFSIFWWMNVNIPPFPSKLVFFLEDNLYPALIQLPSILADLGIAYLIYRIIAGYKKIKTGYRKELAVLAVSLFLFNPVVWYNSSVWGQTDSIINFFALLAFYLLVSRKITWATLSFFVSLFIKASLLIFVPVFIIVVLRQKYKLEEIILSIGLSLIVVGLLTFPFSQGEPFSFLFLLYKDKVFTQQLQVITANAFNLWALIAGIHEQSHTLMLGPFTYQAWGLFLFAISYLPALFIVFRKQTTESIFWSLSIISVSSFMLLTNMHERYLYPFFPVFTIITTIDMSILPLYLAISGISLINLYNFWWVPRINVLVNILSAKERIAPRILAFFNLSLFIYLYNRFLRLLKTSKI